MTEDFDDKYGRIHAEIQEKSDLVRAIFKSTRENLPRRVESYMGIDRRFYFPIGLTHNRIYLGVDLKNAHKILFPEILSMMRLLYEESNGKIDLLNVFALLVPSGFNIESYRFSDDNCLGIVSEDLSDNGTRHIEDTDYDGPYSELLVKVFGQDAYWERCVFRVGGLIQERRNPRGILPNKVTRRVAADLDHLAKVSLKYKERFEAYQAQYEKDERFMIHEV